MSNELDLAESVSVELTNQDLLAVNNALNEILRGPEAIGEWEFHARIGATRGEAESLLDRINELVMDRLKPANRGPSANEGELD
jgi:hypothetical protein